MSRPKYVQAADRIRAQIESGELAPGQPAPSGATLACATGFSIPTCRRALRILLAEGALMRGASPHARPRVPSPARSHEQAHVDAAQALSAELGDRRRAAGLTQPRLSELAGVSVTAIGHAETGRLWQSRRFWEVMDPALSAGGKLLHLHDAYRAAQVQPAHSTVADEASPTTVTIPAFIARIVITWASGEVMTLYPRQISTNT